MMMSIMMIIIYGKFLKVRILLLKGYRKKRFHQFITRKMHEGNLGTAYCEVLIPRCFAAGYQGITKYKTESFVPFITKNTL
jgi:hypothetical protein